MEQLFKPSVIWDSILAIIPNIPITMLITVIAGLLGLLFGFVLAVLRLKKIPVLAQLATVYISFIRGLRCWYSSSYPITEYRCCCA